VRPFQRLAASLRQFGYLVLGEDALKDAVVADDEGGFGVRVLHCI